MAGRYKGLSRRDNRVSGRDDDMSAGKNISVVAPSVGARVNRLRRARALIEGRGNWNIR